VCDDGCSDNSAFKHTYTVKNGRIPVTRTLNCEQISSNQRSVNELCKVGEVRKNCQETCDACDSPSQSPSTSPALGDDPSGNPVSGGPGSGPHSVLAPSSAPPSPSSSVPSSSGKPSIDPDCDDLRGVTFHVAELEGIMNDNGMPESTEKTCVWLGDADGGNSIRVMLDKVETVVTKTFMRQRLCIPEHSAYHICEETCFKCTDDCVDNDLVSFLDAKPATFRSCAWVSKINSGRIGAYCQEGQPWHDACPETCNTCP
jgi:hypothetical protein